jgi:hypothetical protein
MDRREFLTKAGRAVALAAIAGETGLINASCQSAEYSGATVTKPDFEVESDPLISKVVLARNEDHAVALRSTLDAIGGIGRFVKKGERVLLKPNAAFDRVPEQGVTTNPVVVGEMTRQCRAAGASDVIVTDYGGSRDPRKVFSRSGIQEAVEQNGGRIVFLRDDDFLEADLKGKFINTWPVLKHVFEVDRLITQKLQSILKMLLPLFRASLQLGYHAVNLRSHLS